MNKILKYSLCLLAATSLYACSDDDDVASGSNDRMFMTMFRVDNNTGKGDSDPYNCTVVDINDVHLYWYAVDNCAGYRIKWALQPSVSGGKTAWENADTTGLIIGDTILPPEQVDCVIKDLNYQTDYRFAIQTLHSLDLNDPLNSKWYGYGDGRQWADWLGLQTGVRYEVPTVIQASEITKTSMRINLNRSIAGYTATQMQGFREHFTDDGTNFKVDYLTIKASFSSPNAVVPTQFAKYTLTSDDWARGYVDVEGLSENSVYNIDVWDKDIAVPVDACYNSLMKRTKGEAGPPILITHVETKQDTIGGDLTKIYDISSYHSMKLDNIIDNYCASNDLAENQVFYLEGGKTYHFTNNSSIYKGLTIRTNPKDLEAGKGKAKLLLSGMTQTGSTINTCNFMLGRQPQPGENSSIALDIDSVRFMDLDVDVPLAKNYGHSMDGSGYGAVGNYFMNMYSNGMGINVNLLEWSNCTFTGIIRGFFRIQGSNDFNIHNIVMRDCEFYNDGYYANTGSGYQYFFADHNGRPKSNILENIVIENNTFYDSPMGSLITDNNRNLMWDESVRWNVTINNNTFINFQTRSASPIVNFRYLPGGSKITMKNNFITVTADANDALRTLNCAGSDIRNIQGGDGSGNATFDVANNWSTNNTLTAGQIFSTQAFSASSNSMAKFKATSSFPSGLDELNVHVDNLSATELMVSPNPKHTIGTTANHLDHHTDNLDGLYFQNTDKVRNSNIYKLGIGASKWRQNLK
jgi:hypothetical protein